MILCSCCHLVFIMKSCVNEKYSIWFLLAMWVKDWLIVLYREMGVESSFQKQRHSWGSFCQKYSHVSMLFFLFITIFFNSSHLLNLITILLWYTEIKEYHSPNFLYQGFAEMYFLGIYIHSKAYNQTNWGSVCIFLSNGATNCMFLHWNITFV